MKKLFLFSLFMMITAFLFAQSTRDIVTLKNGSIIKGLIVEYTAGEEGQIKIKTGDGSLLVYPSSEVVKMTKESSSDTVKNTKATIKKEGEFELNDYGTGQFSIGVAIGGGGIIGAPVQFHVNPKITLEAGLFYRPVALTSDYSDDIEFKGSLLFSGGANLYLNKFYKKSKDKIKRNGVAIKAGRSFGNYSQSFFMVGWANEGFRKGNVSNSLVFELGLGILNSNFSDEYSFYEPETSPLVYWKIHWNFYTD